ncbi:hypothetical protein HK104_005173 [Borealophlyctis nickersoniae]|nr:hypothetical protein HK104_005173 [Borealophlyctis nickersoniae]
MPPKRKAATTTKPTKSTAVKKQKTTPPKTTRSRVDSNEKLQNLLDSFRNIYDDPDQHKELYHWTFKFAKESPDQKVISMETGRPGFAKAMWGILLPDEKFPQVRSFIEFLDETNPVKAINKDQWTVYLEFVGAVGNDLEGYDPNSAWPTLIDNYVEWRKDQLEQD